MGHVHLKRSLHIKRLNGTFLFVGQICAQDKVIVFTKHEAVIPNIEKFSASERAIFAVITRIRHSGLYETSAEEIMQSAALTVKPLNDINRWHIHFIHANLEVLKSLHQSSVDFLTLKENL